MNEAEYFLRTTSWPSSKKMAVFSKDICTDLLHHITSKIHFQLAFQCIFFFKLTRKGQQMHRNSKYKSRRRLFCSQVLISGCEATNIKLEEQMKQQKSSNNRVMKIQLEHKLVLPRLGQHNGSLNNINELYMSFECLGLTAGIHVKWRRQTRSQIVDNTCLKF